MSRARTNAAITALLVAQALTGCASRTSAPPATDATSPAAVIGDRRITLYEVDDGIADELARVRSDYEMALYQARKEALDARIENEVLGAEASSRGLSVEELLAAEVEDKLVPATAAELEAFYETYEDQLDGAPFALIADRIRAHLDGQQRAQRHRALLGELRKRHAVRVLLEPPRVEVEVVGPELGPPAAKVTILVYSDFECPFCARAEPTLRRIRETWPDAVRFVFRHYPLPFHPLARPAAAAASCADEQGAFWPLHDHLFETGDLEPDAIRSFLGRRQGFELAAFDACLREGRGDAVVARDVASAARVRVDGTPHFFVNGVRLSGAQPFEAFADIITSELAR